MCLLVFGAPGFDDIADVSAFILHLSVVAHGLGESICLKRLCLSGTTSSSRGMMGETKLVGKCVMRLVDFQKYPD